MERNQKSFLVISAILVISVVLSSSIINGYLLSNLQSEPQVEPLKISNVRVFNKYYKGSSQGEPETPFDPDVESSWITTEWTVNGSKVTPPYPCEVGVYITLEWKTNRAADSVVEYNFTTFNDQQKNQKIEQTEMTTSHRVHFQIVRGATYHFQIESTDANKVTAVSQVSTFKTPLFWVYTLLPMNVTEPTYSQILENSELICSIPPSGVVYSVHQGVNLNKKYGLFLYWNKEDCQGFRANEAGGIMAGEVNITFKAVISRRLNTTLLAQLEHSDSAYPIVELPEEMQIYLQPTEDCQANNTEIIELAKELAGNLTKESAVVAKTMIWVSENIEYTDEAGYWDALNTLKNRRGGCDGFTFLTCALLRPQGIPARAVWGWLIDPDDSLGIISPKTHYWVQVYYQNFGWVDYEPQAAVYGLPYRIEFETLPLPSYISSYIYEVHTSILVAEDYKPVGGCPEDQWIKLDNDRIEWSVNIYLKILPREETKT